MLKILKKQKTIWIYGFKFLTLPRKRERHTSLLQPSNSHFSTNQITVLRKKKIRIKFNQSYGSIRKAEILKFKGMKKLIQKLTLILIIFSNIILANAQWVAQNSGTTNQLGSIYFKDLNTGYIVGDYGTILKTTDGGTNWIPQNSGTNNYLSSVFFTDNNNGFVVGSSGTLLRTTDGGSNWVIQNSQTSNHLYSINFIDLNTGYVVGANGTILKTTNGGIDWTLQTSGTTNSLISIFFTDENTGYTVGANGTILKTTNGGDTWVGQVSGYSNLLISVFFTDNNTGYVVGVYGKIIKTINGGTNWTNQSSGTSSHLRSIYFTDENNGYITGENGKILRTTNGGTNWINQSSGTNSHLLSVYFVNPNLGYIVGSNGTILKTANGGTNWLSQTSGVNNCLNSVFFIDTNTGYVVGEYGTILKTSDGGSNWITKNCGFSNNLNSLYFIDINTGYVVGDNGLILKTTDGGSNWTIQNSGTTEWLFSVYFTDNMTGYVVGNSNTILKTTNGGLNWTSQTTGNWSHLYSVFFTNNNTGYAVGGYGGVIYKTINGGANWNEQSNETSNWLNSVFFIDDNIGYIVGEYGTILKTINGGTNWITLNSGTSILLKSVFFTDPNIGYVVGEDGTILFTSDGGLNWVAHISGTYNNLNSIYFNNANIGFIVGYGGEIIKKTLCTGVPQNPEGMNFLCIPSNSYLYTTNGASYANSYSWSLKPNSAGTISGTGTTASVTWNTSYNGTAIVKVQGVTSGCIGETSSIKVAINNSIGSSASFDLSLPANGTWVSSQPLFQWTASLSAQKYTLYIDGVIKKDSINETSYKILPNEELSTGMHTWYVVANNGCTIQSNETRSFLVDIVSPSPFNLISPIDNSWTTSTQPTLTWNASIDAQSGIAKYQLWIDGVLNRDSISSISTSTTPINILSNGSHTWEVRAVDNSGNIRISSQIWTINIDNLPPSNGLGSCLYFDGDNDFVGIPNSSTLNLNYNYTIELWVKSLPQSNYWYYSRTLIGKLYSNSFLEGDWSLFLEGDSENPRNVSFWASGFGILTTTAQINQDDYTHIAVTLNGTQNNCVIKIYFDGIEVASSVETGLLNIGSSDITFGQRGTINNGSDFFHGYIDEIRFWNCTRSQSQIIEFKNVVLNENIPNLVGYWRFNEGTGNLAYDNSSSLKNGVINGAIYQNSNLNSSLKLCNLIFPTNNQFTSTNTPNFSWTSTYDAGIGFKKYQLWIDGNMVKDNLSDTTWTIINPLTYGQHTWYIKGYDSLDNNQQSSIGNFIVDNVRPNPFNLTAPANNEIVMFPTPNLSWQSTLDSTGGAGMKKYQLWINGVVNRDSIPMNTTTVSPANVLPQGAYTWFVKAYDNVGNIRQSTETRVFYVDWEAPTSFELVSPTDNQTLLTPYPTFVWHPSSDIGSGLDRYEITISGYQPIVVLATDTSYNLPFNLPNGNYSWFVKAYDHSGAFTSSNTNSFTIDVPLPEQPSTPTGLVEKCIGSVSTTYTTTGANYAENYVWSISPTNAGTIAGTGLIGTVVWSNTFSGIAQITVTGQNIVGTGIASSPISVTVYPATIPGTVSGNSTICLGQQTSTLTLSNYSGTILKWQKRFNGGSWSDINQTNTTYFETPIAVGLYEYRAEVQNEICPSLFSTIASVTVGDVPANAGTISGPTSVCSNQYGVTYSITPINGASYYHWTLPTGVTGVSTSNTINANFTTSAQSGFITVHGVNDCGDGVGSILVVSLDPLPDTAGVITGSAIVCQGENAVIYSVPNIDYASSYLWTLPNGVIGTSTTNSITVNYGINAISGNITVKGTNSCGNGVVSTKAITVNPLPANAGTISGSSTVCQGQNAVTYTVPNIANATSYLWTLPNGAIGTSTTNSITVDYNTTAISGNITVKGINACGDGVVSSKAITVNPLPVAAGTISGNETVCQGQTFVTYTVPVITNATSYVWTLPTGATGTSSTNSITVSYGTTAVSGNISVKGMNSCGEGVISNKSITVNPLPDPAETISGNATVCQGETLVNYSVPDISNATSYLWTLPTGATGTSTTNLITVNYGTTAVSGNITVKGTNSCGNGVISTKAITVNPLPAAAGTISGSVNVCQGQNAVTYTVPSIANANTYIWSLPNGATGTSTINSISVSFSTTATSGNITVKGNNACGDGIVSTKAITVHPLPDAAGIISGNGTVCQGENSIVYTVPAITNALSYLWTLPTGATGTSITNSITVSYGNTAISGNITVKGSNACGEGDISTKTITVKNRSTYTIDTTVCDSYIAPDGQIYSTSGTKTAILTNAIGCDSVISINLTVKQSTSSTINATVCDTYTAPDGQIYTTSGIQTAIIPNVSGCDSTITINLIVNTTPETPTISLEDDRLVSSAVVGNQWYNLNGMIPNETNQELVLTENGTYFVIVTQNDCPSDSSNLILVNNVLVQKFDKNFIIINPNPFTDQLTIKNQSAVTFLYYMYNGVGQLILQGTLDTDVMLNTSDLAKGLYIIKFVNSLGQVYYKVVKQ